MDIFKILEGFKLLSGLASHTAAVWLPLCSSCAVYIKKRLKPDVEIEEYADLLYSAASALVYYQYTAAACARDGGTYFSAGDVKVSQDLKQAHEAAKILRDNALESIQFLFKSEDFCFLTTEGGDVQ